MSKPTVGQRAMRGAIEGAATGLAVALLRTGLKLFREGIPDDLATQLPAIMGYFASAIIFWSYVFAVGRTIADGLIGSIGGATILGVCGLFVGTTIPSDPMGPPYPLLFAGITGAIAGAPLGALIHRFVVQGRLVVNDESVVGREQNRPSKDSDQNSLEGN